MHLYILETSVLLYVISISFCMFTLIQEKNWIKYKIPTRTSHKPNELNTLNTHQEKIA